MLRGVNVYMQSVIKNLGLDFLIFISNAATPWRFCYDAACLRKVYVTLVCKATLDAGFRNFTGK